MPTKKKKRAKLWFEKVADTPISTPLLSVAEELLPGQDDNAIGTRAPYVQNAPFNNHKIIPFDPYSGSPEPIAIDERGRPAPMPVLGTAVHNKFTVPQNNEARTRLGKRVQEFIKQENARRFGQGKRELSEFVRPIPTPSRFIYRDDDLDDENLKKRLQTTADDYIIRGKI